MNWAVEYIDSSGQNLARTVSGSSVDDVLKKLNISEDQIIDISQKSMSFNLGLKTKVKTKDQGIILTALSSAEHSGNNTLSILSEVVAKCGYKYTPSLEADTISKRLRELGFNELAVLVVESGIESGKLAESLGIAASELDRLDEQSSSLAKDSKMGVVYHLMGLALFFVAPIMAEYIVGPMVHSGQIKLTDFSQLVFDIGVMNDKYTYWALPLIVILVGYFRISIFKSVKKIPILGLPYHWIENRRAIQFNLAMNILISSGYPPKVVPVKMLKICSKNEHSIYDSMIEAIDQGATVSSQITEDDWPYLYVLAVTKFENNILASQKRIISNATSMLKRNDASISSGISRILSLSGLLSAGFGVLLLAGGIMLPMLSVQL